MRNKVRVDYNRDSSLDESKIQKSKNKPQKKRKTKPKLDESSPDEFYEMYLEDKRKKLKVKKQQRATMRNVEISTPVQTKLHKKKENLLFEVSPIRAGDGSMIEEAENDKSRGASLYLELRQKRLQEIEKKEEERMKNRRKRPLRSSENIHAPIEEKVPVNIDPIKESWAKISEILPDESLIIHKRRKVSGNTKKNPARDKANSMNSEEWLNDLTVPEINVSEASENEDEISLKSLLNASTESKEEEKSQLDIPEEVSLTQENEKIEESLEQLTKSAKTEELLPENSLLTQAVPSFGTPKSSSNNQIYSPLCDLEKTFENVIEEISRKLAKKSVGINLVPAVRNISYHKSHSPRQTITTRSSRKHSEVSVAKKSVGFSLKADESTKTVSLQPGKWRKSQNTEKRSLSSNIPVESKVERYSEKIVSVLENCEYKSVTKIQNFGLSLRKVSSKLNELFTPEILKQEKILSYC